MRHAVMGDSVNLGSRLESVNKVYGTHLLVSEATMEVARDAFEFREIDSIVVAGRDEPERIFALLGRRSAVAPSLLDLAGRYAVGLAAYRRRAWGEAETAFRQCGDLAPNDGPSRALLERIPALAAKGLPEGWNGAWLLAEK